MQIDVAKIKKEGSGGEGILATIHKEIEEFKKKLEEQQAKEIKKLAYNDRKNQTNSFYMLFNAILLNFYCRSDSD